MSFRWRTISDWNGLNLDLRLEDNLRLFKSNLKKHIIESRPPDRPRQRHGNPGLMRQGDDLNDDDFSAIPSSSCKSLHTCTLYIYEYILIE